MNKFLRIICSGCLLSAASTLALANPAEQNNLAPEIGSIPDIRLGPDMSAVIELTLADDHTAPDALQLSFRSDVPQVVGSESFAIEGSGNNRTLIVTPKARGTAAVSLIVTDQEGRSSVTGFLLTVEPPRVARKAPLSIL